MNLFLKKEDLVHVKVWAWEDENNNIEATAFQNEIPANVDSNKVLESNFWFRRPNFLDSNEILGSSYLKSMGEDLHNAVNFQNTIIRKLLTSWDLKNDGKDVPVNSQSINELCPSVARAAVAGVVDMIKI